MGIHPFFVLPVEMAGPNRQQIVDVIIGRIAEESDRQNLLDRNDPSWDILDRVLGEAVSNFYKHKNTGHFACTVLTRGTDYASVILHNNALKECYLTLIDQMAAAKKVACNEAVSDFVEKLSGLGLPLIAALSDECFFTRCGCLVICFDLAAQPKAGPIVAVAIPTDW